MIEYKKTISSVGILLLGELFGSIGLAWLRHLDEGKSFLQYLWTLIQFSIAADFVILSGILILYAASHIVYIVENTSKVSKD